MKHIYILIGCVLMPALTWAQSSDDLGMDISVSAEKKLCTNVDFTLEGNARTQDNTSKIERWDVGGTLGIKLINTKKFDLKASAGWEYIWQNNLAEREDKYETYEYYTPEGIITENVYEGYNETPNYWRPRHRTTVAITASYSPNKRWTLSLKESVQYSHYLSASKTTYKYRLQDEDDPQSIYLDGTKVKDIKAKDRTVLRSKVTVKNNIRHSAFSPYVSMDFGCGLNYKASKWKFTAGTDYKLSKKSKLDVFYRFQTEHDDEEPNGHLIGIGYNFRF